MSQDSTNPAWQGAIEVANARLKIIDQAIAKLEAVAPDNGDSQPKKDNTTPPERGGGQVRPSRPQNPNPSAGQVIAPGSTSPSPIPDSSRQALESFLAGRFGNV